MTKKDRCAASTEELGRIIADVRRRAGFTNRALLAEKTGYSEDQIKKIETGRRRPSLNSLLCIAQACRLDFEEFRGLQIAAVGLHGLYPLTPESDRAYPKAAQAMAEQVVREIKNYDEREIRERRQYEEIVDEYLHRLPEKRRSGLKNLKAAKPLVAPEIAWLLVIFHRLLMKCQRERDRQNP